MTDNTERTRNKKNLAVKKTAIIIAVIIIFYAGLGFFAAPPILKSKLQKIISNTFGVTATVKNITVNPFALSVSLKGFTMVSDAKTLLQFGELYINFQLSSLFHRAYTFSTIRLIGPESLVEILPDRSLNWSALIPAEQAGPSEKSSDKEIVPVLIHRLQIEKGLLNFSDLSQPTPFEANFFPIEMSVDNFSTCKNDDGLFEFSTTLGKGGVINWKGSLSVNPLRSQGTFDLRGITLRTLWDYLQHQVNFEVTNGFLDITSQYILDAETNPLHFELKDGFLTIKEFALCEKGNPQTLLSFPHTTCSNVAVNNEKKVITIASLTSSNAKIAGWRNSDGTINYQTLFAFPSEKEKESLSSPSNENVSQKNGSWGFSIDRLSLKNYGVEFEDRTLDAPVFISLGPVALDVKNVTNQEKTQSEIDLRLKVNTSGNAEIKGTAGISPQMADFKVNISELDLKPFQPYIDAVAKINLSSGKASVNGFMNYQSAENGVPKIRYRGEAHIGDLEINDRERAEDLLKWKSLELKDLEVDAMPNRLSISDIVFTEPYARVIIFSDGSVNLSNVFSKPADKTSDQATSAKSEHSKGSVPISINSVNVIDGSLNFADLSITPNFATGIQSLNGTVKGLSSDTSARADVSLKGAVDQYAPVNIKGKINLLSPSKFADITASFKNMELTTMTPYSGKFAGYKIEKGKISLDLGYKLDGSKLKGENKIFLSQLTLGEQVQSPSATKLPVSLAIALLKDRAGNIDINLPIKGNLDDPEFSYGQLVITALVNLITKIVTSPFAALGSLIGGSGEELSHIDFEYGNAELTLEETEKLHMLARALYERPSLRLEIRGIADKTSDRRALAKKELIMMLKKIKADELGIANEKVPQKIDDILLSDEEYLLFLTKAYHNLQENQSEIPQADKENTGDITQRMEEALIETVTVEEIDLHELAKERAQQIKGYLINSEKIENDRLFILDIEIIDRSKDDKAQISLSLS